VQVLCLQATLESSGGLYRRTERILLRVLRTDRREATRRAVREAAIRTNSTGAGATTTSFFEKKICLYDMNKYCVCLLCRIPNDIQIHFLSSFTKYDIYVIIDDNSKCYKEQYAKLRNVNIIQIDNGECKNAGFRNTCYTLKKEITAWSKSMYYFSVLNKKYDKVWFFEDDVFFYDEETIINIDLKYDDSDLLTKSYGENKNGDKRGWHWANIDIKFPPPYYCAMVCATRMSSSLLSKIKDYAYEHNTLFFLEALFPTMCKINNMKYDTPSELKNIDYRRNFYDTNINKHELFHPVKDIQKHIHYRELLKNHNFSK